jgi:outer membrane protein
MFHTKETLKGFLPKTLIFLLLILSTVSSVSFAQKSSQRIGYVESEKIISQMPEAKNAEKRLQSITKRWDAEFNQLKKDYEEAIADYERKKATMTAAAKSKKEGEIIQKQRTIQEFQAQKLGRGGEYEQQQAELLKPIRQKVMSTIQKVAKKYGYSLILEKGGLAGVVLYGDKKDDLTFKVLDELK